MWLLLELELDHEGREYTDELLAPFLEVYTGGSRPLTVAGYDNIVQYLIEKHDAKLRRPSWFV